MIHTGAGIRGINGWCPRRFAAVDHGTSFYTGWQRGEGHWSSPNALEGGIDYPVPRNMEDIVKVVDAIIKRERDELIEAIAQDLRAGLAQTYGIPLDVLPLPAERAGATDEEADELSSIRAIHRAAKKGSIGHALNLAIMEVQMATDERVSFELQYLRSDGRVASIVGNGGIQEVPA